MNTLKSIIQYQEDKLKLLMTVSDPVKAQKNMDLYVKSLGLNHKIKVIPSTKHNKKYQILNPLTNHWVHFGSIDYEDFLKHKDKKRQKSYFDRFTNMLSGDHDSVKDPFSPYNLSLYVLWM
jgi:hypothetical protein